jgi:hypothetical protein
MLDQSTSANDPIFFIHHSFVDMIWEIWRQRAQVESVDRPFKIFFRAEQLENKNILRTFRHVAIPLILEEV